MNNGTWPSRISVVVLLFDTKEGGKQWFEEFDTQCKASNIDILDSVLGATKEEFKNGKSYHLVLFQSKTEAMIRSAICADFLSMKSSHWRLYFQEFL